MKSKDLDKVDKGIAMNNNKQPKRKWEIADNDGIIHIFDNQKDYILFIKKETAKQIFSDLDSAAWQQVKIEKLDEFLKKLKYAKNEEGVKKLLGQYSTIGFDADKYEAVEKKYGVRNKMITQKRCNK